MLRTESSHEEGGVRLWGAATTRFSGDSRGKVTHLHAVRVGAPPRFDPVAGSDFTLEADLVLLALGFTGAAPNPMFEETGIGLDGRGSIATNEALMTTVPGIFAAGDMQGGQSLVVRAIAEGRRAAEAVDRYLGRLTGRR